MAWLGTDNGWVAGLPWIFGFLEAALTANFIMTFKSEVFRGGRGSGQPGMGCVGGAEPPPPPRRGMECVHDRSPPSNSIISCRLLWGGQVEAFMANIS